VSGAPAIFLDRDGVLNAVVWRDGKPASPRDLDELVIEAEAPAALQRFIAGGYRLFAVTNQPDVPRGKMTRAALDRIHGALAAALPLEEIAACLHDNADGCACRKPRPGLILDLAARHGLDGRRPGPGHRKRPCRRLPCGAAGATLQRRPQGRSPGRDPDAGGGQHIGRTP